MNLPATIPTLRWRGSPVVLSTARVVPSHLRGKRGTIHRIAPSNIGVPLAAVVVDHCETVALCGLEVLSLDLTDATGRVHARWLLADLVGVPIDDAPILRASRSIGGASWVLGDAMRFGSRESFADLEDCCGEPLTEGDCGLYVVPEAAALDIDDTRRLPDGSPWVQAEALRVLCLSMALRLHPDHPAVNDWRKALETP